MPQRLIYLALHNDYSEDFSPTTDLPEDRCGEIAVRRLLAGNRGHYGCYSADTEVLTRRGWIPWPDVERSDLLLAVDPATGESHFERPAALQEHETSQGDLLYSAQSQRLDLLVTHDHRMVTSSRTKNGWSNWSVSRASETAGKAVRYRLATTLADHERILPGDLPSTCTPTEALRVAGFFFGDGHRMPGDCARRSTLRFSLRRPRKIAFLNEAGGAVGLVEQQAGPKWALKCGELASWCYRHFQSPHGKVMPPWLLALPRAEFLAFLDGLMNSDGTNIRRSADGSLIGWSLDSSEKSAIDALQAAAHLNAIAASISLNNPNEGPGHDNHRPCWRITFSHSKPFARFECQQRGRTRGTEKAVPYSGRVYCASVSTGALLVRRNGKPVVCGNCLEHPHLSLMLQVDHNTAMQLRTHRIGLSFDLQSMRYTGERIEKVARGELSPQSVFYCRPAGTYRDRQGDPYAWTEQHINNFWESCILSAQSYLGMRAWGASEEHARQLLITSYLQNMVITGNARSWLHLLDVRLKADAQDEARWAMDLVANHVSRWIPEIYTWWESHRKGKAILAP